MRNTESEFEKTRRIAARAHQSSTLEEQDGELRRLAAARDKEGFFDRILPLLQPLQRYIQRLLRIVYLMGRMPETATTSQDVLDEVVLQAYKRFKSKPPNLTLEMWLYRLANELLEQYLKRIPRGIRLNSLESLQKHELKDLEEVRNITADVEGEPYMLEDLDDAEIQEQGSTPPVTDNTPEKVVSEEEELELVLQALATISDRDRFVFELYSVEGFPAEQVAKIMGIPVSQVSRTAAQVRRAVVRSLSSPGSSPRRKKTA